MSESGMINDQNTSKVAEAISASENPSSLRLSLATSMNSLLFTCAFIVLKTIGYSANSLPSRETLTVFLGIRLILLIGHRQLSSLLRLPPNSLRPSGVIAAADFNRIRGWEGFV